jgi:hypothetical protein
LRHPLMLNFNVRHRSMVSLAHGCFLTQPWLEVRPKHAFEIHPNVGLPNHVGLAEFDWATSE